MNKIDQIIWDIAIIGGGPAGMMAAGRAAELGAKVIILEKNDALGKKLLLTGGGRCNLTNAEFDNRIFLSKFEKSGKFLFSTFAQFDVKKTLDFFNSKKMETKIEAENRVFPVSDKAKTVLETLVRYMKSGNVKIVSNSAVVNLIKKENLIESIELKNGEKIKARSFILATGGKSHPETGSTGDGFVWLKNIGHTIITPKPALVPIAIEDTWVKQLQGLSISDVKITILQNNAKQGEKKGKIIFTHFGVSGPVILNISKDVGELIKYGDTFLSLDLLPNLNYENLDLKLREIFEKHNNKKIKNVLEILLPQAIIPFILKISNISPETFCNSVTREERLKLGQIIKNMTMKITSLLGADKAIITSGGVALEEVNFKTMQSRLFSNLYLVGDILNINRPSGGYSLQLCWTTGYVAGTAAAISSQIPS